MNFTIFTFTLGISFLISFLPATLNSLYWNEGSSLALVLFIGEIWALFYLGRWIGTRAEGVIVQKCELKNGLLYLYLSGAAAYIMIARALMFQNQKQLFLGVFLLGFTAVIIDLTKRLSVSKIEGTLRALILPQKVGYLLAPLYALFFFQKWETSSLPFWGIFGLISVGFFIILFSKIEVSDKEVITPSKDSLHVMSRVVKELFFIGYPLFFVVKYHYSPAQLAPIVLGVTLAQQLTSRFLRNSDVGKAKIQD